MVGISEGLKVSLKYGCVLFDSPSSSCLIHSSLAWRRSSWKLVSSHIALRSGSSSLSTSFPSTRTLIWKTSEMKDSGHPLQRHKTRVRARFNVSPWLLVQSHTFCRYEDTGRLHRCIFDTQFLNLTEKPPEPNPAPRWTTAPWLHVAKDCKDSYFALCMCN